ncbi:hypothetical protein [Pseudoalteromonas sp. H105]|uniref:hypothetical protein n=1 Tax=Pseudoalteromonas sp. H105 TaxID=1348393 RepID=UPI000732382A|nr:hypothetical protein [Pseudoalteromonas sp. H105]KTF16036.1 hypothetical protein ATS75_06430 [Pseudoalteromonas sp. H105]
MINKNVTLKLLIVLVAALLILFLLSLTASSAMTKEEANLYVDKIKAHNHSPGGKHNMAELSDFLLSDDGKPFYTVNLYQYHEIAQYNDKGGYKEGQEPLSGEQAYKLFSDVMIKLLLNNNSYPIFASNWLNYSSKQWDRIVIVRYPNRKAVANIFANEAYSAASEHKWASIKQHDRFIVQAIHLPEITILLFLLLILTITFCFVLLYFQTKSRLKS